MAMSRKTWSIYAAHIELGVSRQYLGKIAADVKPAGEGSRGPTYWLKDLIAALYGRDDLNATEEKAKLDKVKREREELKLAQDRKELLPASEVEEDWSKQVMNVRARLLALPGKLAPQAAVESDPVEVEKVAKELIYEALTELSEGEK
jgi:hypothetical protein